MMFEAAGTSEDIAMLLAYEKGAELIVAVGTHASMVEFLDKGRAGMASTFLVRLKVGPILVDAKGVSRLYQSRVRRATSSSWWRRVVRDARHHRCRAAASRVCPGAWLSLRESWNDRRWLKF